MIDVAAKSNGAKPGASRGSSAAWSLACSCALSVTLGCAGEVDEVSTIGPGGTGSGDAGSGGTGGIAGMGGSAGTGGAGGVSGYGGGCFQGTFSLGTRVSGEGFDYADGIAVRAHFAVSPQTSDSASDALEAGAFSFSFFFPSDTCNLGASIHGGGALYVDVDGNGECNVTEDDIFVWTAQGGPSGTNVLVSLTPASTRCIGLGGGGEADALAAARHLCPSVGECLAFCGPGPVSASGDSVAFCPAPDAGVPDAGDSGTSQSDAAQ